MKSKLMVILALTLCILLACSGCSAASTNLMGKVKAAEWPDNPAEPSDGFTSSVSGFSWNLLNKTSENKGNILISPASVYIALGMALNGANKETRTAVMQAMQADNLTETQLNEACRDWMTLLMNVKEKTKLTIANSIWYRQEFVPAKDFLQKNADYFAAAARALDFNKASATDIINQWVKDNTQGKIEKIVDKINPEVVMYLINAVYFKAEWMDQFIKASTADGEFAAPSGNSTVKYMYRADKMDYFEGNGYQGILLPYKDGRYAFLAMLPAEGKTPRQLVTGLNPEEITNALKNAKETGVELKLPKFETRFEDSLKNELAALGMEIAFNADLADFSLMNASHKKNLYISEVMHKTYCKIDEIGTEAAAVTSIEVSETSAPVIDHKLYLNRPFVYGIIDTVTGLPLFLGIMENPAGS